MDKDKAVTGEVLNNNNLPKKSEDEKQLDIKRQKISLNRSEQIATKSTSSFDPIIYGQMKQLAADLIDGGASSADAKTPAQLIVKLQAGYELGMTPVESLNSLYIVNGKVTIWGSAVIKRLRLFGWSVGYKNETEDECTIEVSKDDEKIIDTFYFKDAVNSGYTTDSYGKVKVGWKPGQNRKLKLRYGAASQLIKTYLPEVLGSVSGVTDIEQEVNLNADSDAKKVKIQEFLNADNQI